MADNDLKSLARRLRQAGRKDLTRELNKGVADAVKPLRAELPASARSHLPRRGGLAARVAGAKIRVTRKPNGVVLTAVQQYQIRPMDDPGVIRHPVFKRKGEEGRHTVWMAQKIRPGWFSDPANRTRALAAKNLEAALNNVARKLDGG